MRRLHRIFSLTILTAQICLAHAVTGEFQQPWQDEATAIIIDPYGANSIDWDQLVTDKRVIAIIHKATEKFKIDEQYENRKTEAKKRGYLWGSYHLGQPGDPVEQADFYIQTVDPEEDEVIALDIESLDANQHMSLDSARTFIERVKEKTGRYPMVYGNHLVIKTISEKVGRDEVFSKTPLWYARFKSTVTDFPKGTWDTYTLWQFSSEINCRPAQLDSCLYLVPGTRYDMDVNVYNGTIDQLKARWPFDRD